MKRLRKTGMILTDNSGETMVEVLVSFTLLSIMLVVFSQGIAWATKVEADSYRHRIASDEAMVQFKAELVDPNPEISHLITQAQIPYFNYNIKRITYRYEVDGQVFTYIHYVPIITGG